MSGEVTDKLRMQVAAAASGTLNYLVENPGADQRETRLAAVARILDAALCGDDESVLEAKRASGGWKP